MAEYYPLLAKAVGSLPNSTPDTRRIVYERARKALIGQLRTYHPPVPEDDIERESVELDRAIERLETEIAAKPATAEPPPSADVPPAGDVKAAIPAKPPASGGSAPGKSAAAKPASPKPASSKAASSDADASPAPRPLSGALGPAARKPLPPLRPRAPKTPVEPPVAPPTTDKTTGDAPVVEPASVEPASEPPKPVDAGATPAAERAPLAIAPPDGATSPASDLKLPTAKPGPLAPPPGTDAPRPRLEAQRPFAPQPAAAKGPKRRTWIIPLVIAVVAVPVAIAAWKLRVTPETIARSTPTAKTQPVQDNGKIADRVGGATPDDSRQAPEPPSAPTPQEALQQTAPPQDQAARAPQDAPKPAPPPAAAGNPELPVAYRAALLVEAPDLPSKVQTFAGTVVWKLNGGTGDAAGLSVEADVDLPDDKMKATVVFEKNTDASLPASHTIKVRFTMGQGSYSGNVKQINVPQMRREGNSDGEPLAGVTVPVVQNSFLVGLSPGNAETANLRLLSELPWIDIPILLDSGKIAKLTFEKGAAGQRDFGDAVAAWQKQ